MSGIRLKHFVRACFLKCGFNAIAVDRASSSFDMLLEQPGRFLRVQVKSGVLKDGAVVFNASRVPNRQGVRGRIRYSANEVDVFAVFCEELMTMYLMPIGEIPDCGVAYLRVSPPKNGQVRNVRCAKDFEFCRLR
jgi:hypothetical protein